MSQGAAGGRWLIYGARSFAHTVADLVVDIGGEVLGLIDDSGAAVAGDWPGVGTLDEAWSRFGAARPNVALGIGYNDLPARWQAWLRLRRQGWPTPALVHPQAYVARTARIGEGAIVMARAVVDRQARIGEAVVLWPGVIVNHDSSVGVNTFLSPAVVVCGDARIGDHCFIGAAAAIANDATVPDQGFVKMSACWTEGRA
jgi:sugar O-acyltransferase (sialic acid O-acetyltransferase NeuD family)